MYKLRAVKSYSLRTLPCLNCGEGGINRGTFSKKIVKWVGGRGSQNKMTQWEFCFFVVDIKVTVFISLPLHFSLVDCLILNFESLIWEGDN